MYRVAIAEDDLEFCGILKEYIQRYGERNAEAFSVSVFRDGAELLKRNPTEFDILLLDIAMPNVDGMTAAAKIRAKNSDVVIVFITNLPQYAVSGYAVGALDYILKPVSFYKFSLKFQRAVARAQQRASEAFLLVLPEGAERIAVRDLYYVELENRTLIYHTAKGDFRVRGTMRGAEEQLSGFPFARGNQWYLANLMHVQRVDREYATVAGKKLALSRRSRASFLNALTEYLGGGRG